MLRLEWDFKLDGVQKVLELQVLYHTKSAILYAMNEYIEERCSKAKVKCWFPNEPLRLHLVKKKWECWRKDKNVKKRYITYRYIPSIYLHCTITSEIFKLFVLQAVLMMMVSVNPKRGLQKFVFCVLSYIVRECEWLCASRHQMERLFKHGNIEEIGML